MEYTRLGKTGLEVSRICLGCMSFGDRSLGREWVLDLEQSRPIIRAAWEAGINFYDTANVYSAGTSEEITGTVLWELAPREQVVLATKVNGEMRKGPNGKGQSRKAIMAELDNSLRRLKTDYVDLYQIHRWDPEVPVEETMEALHDVVRAGKARYLGASSMWTWQFARAQHAADLNGWTRFVSMQDHYNLLTREEEREMHPYCLDQGVGVIPWSPLARGRLARAWGDDSTSRSSTDNVTARMYQQHEDSDRRIVDAVGEIATERGIPRAQVALAWVLHQPAVTAPIVGATKPGQLDDPIAAVDIELSDDELRRLGEHYVPHAPEGF